MFKQKYQSIALLILFLFSLSLFAVIVYAFGISPVTIYKEDLKKGSGFQTSITVNYGSVENGRILVEFKDDYLNGWIVPAEGVKAGNNYEISVPEGSTHYDVLLNVKIPNDAPNGEHKTNFRLMIVSAPKVQTNGGVGSNVQMAAQADVDLFVIGVDKKSFEILSATLPQTSEETPLQLSLKINNKGNVQLLPLTVNLSIFTKENELIYSSLSKGNKVIPSFTISDTVYTFENTLKEGYYDAKVDVFDNNLLVYSTELPLEIKKPKNTMQTGFLEKVNAPSSLKLNEETKFKGLFSNKDSSIVSAKLVAELYQNNELVETLMSEPSQVNSGNSAELSITYLAKKDGKFTLKAYVIYDDKISNTIETDFIVEEKQAQLAEPKLFANTMDLIIILLIFIVVLIIVYLILHRTHKEEIKETNSKLTKKTKPKK
ncbi:hypothetical protein HY636_05380 [Candidatus Woesearchaeota archaeon]|nr:hypothetical protein [Candidatus Woesearchaeota archaeon]